MGLYKKDDMYALFSKSCPVTTWWGNNSLPNPELFLMSGIINIFYKEQSHYLGQIYYIEKNFWAKSSLYLSLVLPNKLPYVVDGLQYCDLSNNLKLQYNFNFMLTDTRLHIYTKILENNFTCNSISCIFLSCVWLERELSDFTGLLFEGLLDNRRLLLDYFQDKQYWKTHIANERSYSNLVYEVSLNF